MSEFFLPQAGSECPLYAAVRDQDRLAPWRRWVEDLWSCFKPLVRNGFRRKAQGSSEHPAAFAQCLAEMWCGVVLKERQGERLVYGDDGQPDFHVKLANGQVCWIEVVAPGPGEGDDRLKPLPVGAPGEFVTCTYSVEPKVLRICSALREKARKFQCYRERGVVGSDHLAVIAVSEFALGDHAGLQSSRDMLLSALEGMGHPVVGFGGKPDVTHTTRDQVRKVGTGAPVTTLGWRAGLLDGVDAVMYSNVNLDAAHRKSDASDWCWIAAPGLGDNRLESLGLVLGGLDRIERRDENDRLGYERVSGYQASRAGPVLDDLLANRPIERVARVTNFADAPSEVDAWADFDGMERLKAMLEMRERYARWKDGVEPRLERVLGIARRA